MWIENLVDDMATAVVLGPFSVGLRLLGGSGDGETTTQLLSSAGGEDMGWPTRAFHLAVLVSASHDIASFSDVCSQTGRPN